MRKTPTRRAGTIADAQGRVGCPWHVQSLLENLLARKDISAAQHAAGRQFSELFYQAGIATLRASNFEWKPKTTGHNHPGSERAYRMLTAALTALGGQGAPTGSIAFAVLGLGDSLTLWASTQHWTGRSTAAAKGVLISTLELLAQHFGLTKAAYR